MSKFYPVIDGKFQEFIEEQRMFFTATAPTSGWVNVSPKGMDTFRALGQNIIAYMDQQAAVTKRPHMSARTGGSPSCSATSAANR